MDRDTAIDIWDAIWRDKHGDVVIWQRPNVFLIGWVVFTVACLITGGKTADILAYIGEASLGIWCLLEIFKGVNYFRRFLGVIVLIFTVMSVIKNF